MLKVIGALIVLLSCSLIGITIAKGFRERPKLLKSWEGALQHLETEIIYGAVPLMEALEQVSLRSEGEVAKFFDKVNHYLSTVPGITAAEAWADALEEWKHDSYLKDSDLEIIKTFGQSIGYSDRYDQEKHLNLAKIHLRQAGQEAAATAEKSVRPWNYLGILGGLLIVLILI